MLAYIKYSLLLSQLIPWKNKEKGSSKNEEPKLVFWMFLLMLVNERIYPIQPIQIRLSAIRSFITLSRLEAIFFEWMILPSILSEVIFWFERIFLEWVISSSILELSDIFISWYKVYTGAFTCQPLLASMSASDKTDTEKPINRG